MFWRREIFKAALQTLWHWESRAGFVSAGTCCRAGLICIFCIYDVDHYINAKKWTMGLGYGWKEKVQETKRGYPVQNVIWTPRRCYGVMKCGRRLFNSTGSIESSPSHSLSSGLASFSLLPLADRSHQEARTSWSVLPCPGFAQGSRVEVVESQLIVCQLSPEDLESPAVCTFRGVGCSPPAHGESYFLTDEWNITAVIILLNHLGKRLADRFWGLLQPARLLMKFSLRCNVSG